MLTKTKTAIAAAIVLSAASASVAKDAGPPMIDIEKLCRADIDALRAVFTTSEVQAMDACVADEQAARDQLIKNWASYPPLAKAQCVQPQEYLPGYVEWQSCIEMTRDVLDLREHPAAAASTIGSGATRQPSRPAKADPAGRECPAVKYGEDSSIEHVTNC
jgi:hypothetical protein